MKSKNTGLPRCARNDEPSNFYHNSQAFTIVELLVVIVVIAILAAITIVSYTNITKQAHISSLASGLNSSMKALETYKEGTSSTETYPISLATMTNLKLDSAITWSYTTTSARNEYCLQGTIDGTTKSISSTNSNITNTPCGTLDGLVGWWKLNGNAKDSSGNGNNGVVYGNPTLAAGEDDISSHAYLFDGVDDYITANVSIPYSSGTVSLFVKNPTVGAGPYIFRSNANTRTYFLMDSSGYINFIKGYSAATTIGNVLYQQSTWQHFVLVWYTSSGVLYGQAFSNSTPLSSPIQFTDDTLQNGTYITIAAFSNVGTQNVKGIVDDVRIYNRALSASEIQALYNQGAQ